MTNTNKPFTTFVAKTEEENFEFCENIESAIGDAKYAIGEITYDSYPSLNKDLIDDIKKAYEILENVLERVGEIKKPVLDEESRDTVIKAMFGI